MGFDINIRQDNETLAQLYLSYNWSDFSKIWYIRYDMFDHKGTKVQENLERAIKHLTEELKVADVVPMEYNNWWYGASEDGESMLPHERRLEIFKHILQYFLTYAIRYPNATFYDADSKIQDSDDDDQDN